MNAATAELALITDSLGTQKGTRPAAGLEVDAPTQEHNQGQHVKKACTAAPQG